VRSCPNRADALAGSESGCGGCDSDTRFAFRGAARVDEFRNPTATLAADCVSGRRRTHRDRSPATTTRTQAMKFTGDLFIDAPRDAVFAKVRDARFFASCVEGVQELNEIDADHYTAVLETRVAYLKFRFNVAVEVVRVEAPAEIEAKIEGAPLGIVGRLTASSVTRLADENGGTKVSYEIEAALTGKLGSLGQPVLRAKARDMERQFAERLQAAFAVSDPRQAE
jgi:carbon monoxide dehydrogenase subunit G